MAGQAQAAAVIDQNTGLASPDVLVDFGDNLYPDSTVITNQFSAFGVNFSGIGVRYSDSNNNLPSLTEGFLFNSFGQQLGTMLFSSNVTDAVFSWRTSPGTNTTFVARLGGTLVEQFTVPTDNGIVGGRYYGFTGIVFDRIFIGSDDWTLDNLQFNLALPTGPPIEVVPLPAALSLFGGALTMLGFFGRRKSRKPSKM